MSFLQQVLPSIIDENNEAVVVAIHQSSATLLVVQGAYIISKRKNKQNCWIEIGRWMVPPGISRFVNYSVIEAYAVFVLVQSDSSCTNLLFFDLNMKECNTCELAKITGISCADMDQNRKEIILGAKSGNVMSIVIREAKEIGYIYQTIPRKYVKFAKSFLGKPMQLVSQDLYSTFIVLSENGNSFYFGNIMVVFNIFLIGNVICFETGTFEVLWHIKSIYFLSKPVYIWADKFGPNFILKFHTIVKDYNLNTKGLKLEHYNYHGSIF